MSSVRLGLMAPMTGLVEIYGQEIVWAARVAVDEINERGGVLGRPLELVIEDDGSLPPTAVPAARRLVTERGCSAIIGNLLSNSRIAVASQVAEPLRISYLNFSFYEGSISGRYFFNFAALPNQQIDRMIPWMAQHYGPKIFFAGNNYEWPRGSIDAAKRVLASSSGEIAGEEYLPIGTSIAEIETLLDHVTRSGADVFVPYFAGADQIKLLTRLQVDVLKIDRVFVDGIEKTKESRTIIRAIIGLGRALGLKLVAEGVENEVQRQELLAHGCDYFQGFYFHRPPEASRFTEVFEHEQLVD